MIPTFEYQDAQGNPVSSSADPAWKYTVINGGVRTVKGGTPEHLVNGKWTPIQGVESRDSTADTEPPAAPAPAAPQKAKAKK